MYVCVCVCVCVCVGGGGERGRRRGGRDLVEEDTEVGMGGGVNGDLKQWEEQVSEQLSKVIHDILLLVDITGDIHREMVNKRNTHGRKN